jgi:hypothetical protein
LEKEPRNETYQYNLAAVRIKSPDSQKNAQAREALEQLAKYALRFARISSRITK